MLKRKNEFDTVGEEAHVCPVCKGTGIVRTGFYPDDPSETSCRACYGTGVIWRTACRQTDPCPWSETTAI